MTYYLVPIPLHKGASQEIVDALISPVFFKHGPPSHLIFDEDQAFHQESDNTLKRVGIKNKTISPYNHGSLKTERHIREMIAKQLTTTVQMWTHCLQACTYAYNSFASPALDG